jgi:hypothetical protein
LWISEEGGLLIQAELRKLGKQPGRPESCFLGGTKNVADLRKEMIA